MSDGCQRVCDGRDMRNVSHWRSQLDFIIIIIIKCTFTQHTISTIYTSDRWREEQYIGDESSHSFWMFWKNSDISVIFQYIKG